jgi:hypothetical protein
MIKPFKEYLAEFANTDQFSRKTEGNVYGSATIEEDDFEIPGDPHPDQYLQTGAEDLSRSPTDKEFAAAHAHCKSLGIKMDSIGVNTKNGLINWGGYDRFEHYQQGTLDTSKSYWRTQANKDMIEEDEVDEAPYSPPRKRPMPRPSFPIPHVGAVPKEQPQDTVVRPQRVFFKLGSPRSYKILDDMWESGKLKSLEHHGNTMSADDLDIKMLRAELIRQGAIDEFGVVQTEEMLAPKKKLTKHLPNLKKSIQTPKPV